MGTVSVFCMEVTVVYWAPSVYTVLTYNNNNNIIIHTFLYRRKVVTSEAVNGGHSTNYTLLRTTKDILT